MPLTNRNVWCFLLAVVTCCAMGADWPQYRGPKRDDVSQETGLLREWPAGGPALQWTYTNAGIGYSGVSVVGDRLYTIGGRGDKEFLIALDLASAKDGAVAEAWSMEVGPLFDWKGNQWSAGPSSTPTVDGDALYALGGMGDLVCVNRADGELRWRKNLPQDLQAQVNPIGGGPKNLGWGFTWSPLVDGDRLICTPGGPDGTVAALDKRTGAVVWRSSEVTDQAAYTSAMPAEIEGVRQYVVLTNQGVFSVSAADGRLLWKHTHRYGTEVINSPIVQGSLVYVTVAAGNGGSDLLRVTRTGEAFAAMEVYSNKNMMNHHGNVVLVEGHIYGASQGRGWACQNLETGEIAWSERRRPATGSLTYADGHIYTYSENDGTVELVGANPTKCNIVGSFKIPRQSTLRKPSGRIWTPPVISGGRLFLRDQENLFCYDVRADK